mmetsp:Transcript_17071/g.47652  ORF Transcript_17071/g.47652 Transcript_17071/m.47652 type:complete len:153 (+) Transcript_17071:419-877(+)
MLPYLLDTGERQVLTTVMGQLHMSAAVCPLPGVKESILQLIDQACGRPTFDSVVSLAIAEGVAGVVSYILGSTEDTDEGRTRLASEVAFALSAAGHHASAQPLLQKCLEIQEAALGTKHATTMATRKSLAAELQALGKTSEAQVLLQCVPAV